MHSKILHNFSGFISQTGHVQNSTTHVLIKNIILMTVETRGILLVQYILQDFTTN